jgi:hypothetical protein
MRTEVIAQDFRPEGQPSALRVVQVDQEVGVHERNLVAASGLTHADRFVLLPPFVVEISAHSAPVIGVQAEGIQHRRHYLLPGCYQVPQRSTVQQEHVNIQILERPSIISSFSHLKI